jgi:hypothetical protein
VFYHSKAQNVVIKDTLNGNPYTLTMDNNVAKGMMAKEENCANNKISKTNTETNSNDDKKIYIPSRAQTNEEICRQNPRISGYKIQVMVVKSNEEANEIRGNFRSKFPNLKVEIDASLRPNYKILAGSYFTKASASGDLKNIRKAYNAAIPVQYRIFCVEAK